MKLFIISFFLCLGTFYPCYSQKADTVKPNKDNTVHSYFIINAGTEINAYFNDKPVSATTISEFNEYVQKNIKVLKDSWVVVTGKPKVGTFDDVLKTLSHGRFKHVSKNILND